MRPRRRWITGREDPDLPPVSVDKREQPARSRPGRRLYISIEEDPLGEVCRDRSRRRQTTSCRAPVSKPRGAKRKEDRARPRPNVTPRQRRSGHEQKRPAGHIPAHEDPHDESASRPSHWRAGCLRSSLHVIAELVLNYQG